MKSKEEKALSKAIETLSKSGATKVTDKQLTELITRLIGKTKQKIHLEKHNKCECNFRHIEVYPEIGADKTTYVFYCTKCLRIARVTVKDGSEGENLTK